MRPSRYLKVYSFEEKPGHLLLFSTKRASKALVRKEVYDSISKALISPQTEKMLSGLGMLVPDLQEERREILGTLDRINRRNTWLSLSVILNLDCNFECVYCYEGGIKGRHYMSDETADLLVEFVKDKFAEGREKVKIDFYGGEPLLSTELIKTVSADLKEYIENGGGEYTFTLVTNGSLFSRKVAEEMIPLGLTGVKITLDGPPELHNTTRPFKSGAGSFDTIIRNIKETAGLLKVGVSGNYQKDNYHKFPLLIECLEKEGLTPDTIYQLKFDPVMNRRDGEGAAADYTDGFMSINEPWVIEAGSFLREKIMERGYKAPKVKPSPCQVELDNAYVVNYDGLIYKCPVFIGKKGYEAGTLSEGVRDFTDAYKVGIWKNDECLACEYLPICFGGCRYQSYVREGTVDKLDCKKHFLDAALETLIKQDIKYGL